MGAAQCAANSRLRYSLDMSKQEYNSSVVYGVCSQRRRVRSSPAETTKKTDLRFLLVISADPTKDPDSNSIPHYTRRTRRLGSLWTKAIGKTAWAAPAHIIGEKNE